MFLSSFFKQKINRKCFISSLRRVLGLLWRSNKVQLSQKNDDKKFYCRLGLLSIKIYWVGKTLRCVWSMKEKQGKAIKFFTKHYINAVNLCQNMLGAKLSLFCNKYFRSLVTTNIGNLQKVNRRHVVPLFYSLHLHNVVKAERNP